MTWNEGKEKNIMPRLADRVAKCLWDFYLCCHLINGIVCPTRRVWQAQTRRRSAVPSENQLWHLTHSCAHDKSYSRKSYKWLPSKGNRAQTFQRDPCSMVSSSPPNASSTCLSAYNRMRTTVFSAVPLLDGALLWQHAAVCLLALFFMSLQVECADYRLRRRKYEQVAAQSGLWIVWVC